MEATGNQNVDLNSQFGTIVATHPHLHLNRNSVPSPPLVVHPCPSFARFCESRISSNEGQCFQLTRLINSSSTGHRSSVRIFYFTSLVIVTPKKGTLDTLARITWKLSQWQIRSQWQISSFAVGFFLSLLSHLISLSFSLTATPFDVIFTPPNLKNKRDDLDESAILRKCGKHF